MGLIFQVAGFDVATSRTGALAQKLKTVAATVFSQVGNEMVSEMKARAPVLTGLLRDNISLTQANEQIMQIVSSAYYSIYVEMGHSLPRGRYVQPHEFFFPVVYQYIPQLTQRMSALLNTT